MTQILLIDLSSIAHPIWHTTQGSTNPNECSIQTVAKVRALASGQAHVAVCCDSGRSFRRDIDPTYKAQRPEADATLMHQIALAVETLKADGFPVWAVKGFEADDLLASATALVTWNDMRPQPAEPCMVTIASSDKDMLQLVSDRVSIHRIAATNKATTVDEAAVWAEYGITPNQLTEWLMLVGDTSDNIIGAKGVGPKTASAMLAKFGNLTDLYAALDKDVSQFKPATVASLTEFRARMETVRQLVTLRTDAPVPFEEVFRERVPADVAVFDGGLSDGDEDMGGLGEAIGGNSVVGEQRSDADFRRTDPEHVPDARSDGKDDAKSSVDSGGGLPDRSKEPTARDHHGPAQQTSAPPIRDTGGSGGLAIRDAEVLPPPPTDVRWQLEPRSMDGAITLAKHMHASRLFSAYGTPQAVLATIMAGRELGMQTQKSLRAFHIIDGKPAESADLIRAQCLQSSVCEYFRIVERSALKATWVTKRKGDPEVSLTYTIEEGRQAWQKDQKAWDGSAWAKRPANMVTKTASSTLARLIYPDVVGGLYCPEELTGEERE